MIKGNCYASIMSMFLADSLWESVMSGIITGPYFKKYFNYPTSYEVGTMVAVLEVGAFGDPAYFQRLVRSYLQQCSYPIATSLAAGRLADTVGRRMTLIYGASIFVVGGAIQSFSTGFAVMIFGRIVSGAGVGLLS
jgi:MFS family permease